MDSGNSGSMQSSSGGDDDQSYDSRAASESISVFFNNHIGAGPMSNPPPQPPPHQPPSNHHNFQHQSSMFDPLSNYFDPISSSSSSRSPQHFTNQNALLNLDLVNWSKNIRSDHNNTNSGDLGAFISSSSPTPPQSRPNFASLHIPQPPQPSGPCSGSNDQSGRNPKKRSRASRRAPTTVLTTDTTNFRAMVQEFTGIPAPPFTSSHFPRSRLDLFGTSSTTFRTPPSHLDSPPSSYLLRPFAHKIQPPFLSSSSPSTSASTSSSPMVDAIISTTTTTNVNSDLGLVNLNPILNFHPLFPKFPFSSFKPQQNSLANDSHLKMSVFEDFGLGPVNTNLPDIVSSDHTRHENNWGGGDEGDEDRDHGLLRSINGNYNNSHTVAANNSNINGKINYSASASDFHGEKGSENVVGARTSQVLRP
ncbi:VQ motif-containing protein [Euphorbia peplus]|nr:VQ motif-containing protein [Euphorbia peplus]